MTMSIRDPLQSATLNLEVAGRQITSSLAVMLTLAVTNTPSTVVSSATSVQLLAAAANRVGATIVNTDTAQTLWLGFNGAAAVVGTGTSIPPLGGLRVPDANIAGQINGIWTGTPTGGASISAYTA